MFSLTNIAKIVKIITAREVFREKARSQEDILGRRILDKKNDSMIKDALEVLGGEVVG